MYLEIKVPQLSESVSEAIVLSWKGNAGDSFNRDDLIAEVETDKVVIEIYAPCDGVLVEIMVAEGESVVANQVMAKMLKGVATSSTKDVQEVVVAEAPATTKASPASKKMIEENSLDIKDIKGSGKRGQIIKSDVISAIKPSLPAASSRVLRVPMSRLRAKISSRLLHSVQNNAILTTFNEVNMASVMALRSKYGEKFNKSHGVKLGFMSFFVKAVVRALKLYPVLNASIDGNDIVYNNYYDIGVAVSTDRGLVVPVLRDADRMSSAEIESKILEYALKARSNKLSIEDITGGTFSITNGGSFGSMMSTPIINPPQSAILGIHAIKDRPIVENGAIVIRPMVYLALSYNHCLIDGRDSVMSLVTIKDALEDPSCLILD